MENSSQYNFKLLHGLFCTTSVLRAIFAADCRASLEKAFDRGSGEEPRPFSFETQVFFR